MDWQFNIYGLLAIIASIVSSLIAYWAWRRRSTRGAFSFAVLALLNAVWSLAYGLEVSSSTYSGEMLMAKIAYVGIPFTPVAWFAFACYYANWRDAKGQPVLTKDRLLALSLVPFVTMLIAWTNEFHGLLWGHVIQTSNGTFNFLAIERNGWYWVHVAYSYALLLLGSVVLIQLLRRFPLFRVQSILLLVGVALPWLTNIIYVFRLMPIPNLDPTSFAFTLTDVCIALGIFKYDLFDIVPIARDAVLESMTDGVVVFDLQNRIVDINLAARKMIGLTEPFPTKPLAENIIARHADLVKRYRDVSNIQEEITDGDGDARRTFEMRIFPLSVRGELSGRVLTLREITERKRVEEALLESETRFRHLSEAAFEGIVIHDQGKVLDANHRFAALFGHERSTVIGMSLMDLIAPLSRELVENVISSRQETPYEANGLRKDSTTFLMEIHARMARYEGRIVRVAAVRDVTASKQAETALRASEEYACAIIDHSLDMIITTDTARRIVQFNRAAQETFGYTHEEVIGKQADMLYASYQESHLMREAIVKEGRFVGEINNRRKDGQVFVSLLSTSVLHGPNGELLGTVGVSRDITKRKQIDNAMRESEERFRGTFEQAAVGIAHVSPDGRFVRVNQKLCDILGYAPYEMLLVKSRAIIYSEDLETDKALMDEVVSGDHTSCSGDLRYIRKDGTLIWVNRTVSLVRQALGTPKYFIYVVQDSTERKRLEQELRDERGFLTQIVNATGQGLTVTNSDRGLELVNPAYARLVGRKPEELLGKRPIDMVLPEDQAVVELAYEARRRGETTTYENRLVRADGAIIPVLTTGSPRWKDDKIAGAISVITDLSEVKRTERALRESEEHFRSIFEASPIAIEIYDQNGRLVNANQASLDIFGLSSIDQVRGFDLFQDPNLPEDIRARVRAGKLTVTEIDFDFGKVKAANLYPTTKSGKRVLEVRITPVRLADDQPVIRFLVQLQDITERKRVDASLEYLSTHDALTGLYNRPYFETELTRLAKSRQYPVSIVMADVDGMKATNDTLGHAAGDELLRQVAMVLHKAFRAEDIIARIGGDEFAIILPRTDTRTTESILTRLRGILEDHSRESQGPAPSLSFGSGAGDVGTPLHRILATADKAMYRDKASKHPEQKNEFKNCAA